MLIFASCSSTKRVPVSVALTASKVRARSLKGFAQEWVERVSKADAHYRPTDVYSGIGVAAARDAAVALNARLYYLSAGMSVVGPARRIPGYDLTVSASGAVPEPIATGKASAADWWGALNRAYGHPAPIATRIRRYDGLVLIALSDAYLRMIKVELLQLTAKQRQKLRLIVADGSYVPPELESQTIRYDQRLQRLDHAPRGALASFSQRALLHFSGLLTDHPRVRAVNSQRRLVKQALAAAPGWVPRSSASCSDEEVLQWLLNTDPWSEQSRTRLLSKMRAEGRACEHSRFAGLCAMPRS